MDYDETNMFISYNDLAANIHRDNVAKGFWPDDVMDRNVGEAIALIHSEITEAYEASFNPELMDDKLPEWPAVWIEIADAAIRILDLGGAHGVDFDLDLVDELSWSPLGDTPYGSFNDDLMELHAAASRVLEDHRKMSKSGEDGSPLYKQSLATLFGKTLAVMNKYNIPFTAIDAKLDYNRSRPYKHGKKY